MHPWLNKHYASPTAQLPAPLSSPDMACAGTGNNLAPVIPCAGSMIPDMCL